MKRGYTKSYRKELDGDIWIMPPLYHRVFYYLRQKAKWQPELFPSRKCLGIWVIPGQFITSIDMIANGVSWTEYGVEKSPNKKTIKTILGWLESNNMIQVTSNGFGTMINIINWDIYQAKDNEEVTANGQGSGQRFTQGTGSGLDTIKEGIKKLKNTKKEIKKKDIIRPENVSDQVWEDFILHRKNKKAPVTQTVISSVKEEADKAGITVEAALKECCIRGWQGFKAEWYNNGGDNGRSRQPVKKQHEADRAAEALIRLSQGRGVGSGDQEDISGY